MHRIYVMYRINKYCVPIYLYTDWCMYMHASPYSSGAISRVARLSKVVNSQYSSIRTYLLFLPFRTCPFPIYLLTVFWSAFGLVCFNQRYISPSTKYWQQSLRRDYCWGSVLSSLIAQPSNVLYQPLPSSRCSASILLPVTFLF